MYYVLCTMYYVLCTMYYVLCTMYYNILRQRREKAATSTPEAARAQSMGLSRTCSYAQSPY